MLVNVRVRPLVSDAISDRDPVRVLTRYWCRLGVELDASESVSILNRLFFSARLEVAESDVVWVRKSDVFSVMADDDPIDANNCTACPLKNVSTKLIEPLRDL